MLDGDDVVHLMTREDGRLRKPTVFATIPGSPSNSAPKVVGHGGDVTRLSESRAFD